jgi:hypothetical protein
MLAREWSLTPHFTSKLRGLIEAELVASPLLLAH